MELLLRRQVGEGKSRLRMVWGYIRAQVANNVISRQIVTAADEAVVLHLKHFAIPLSWTFVHIGLVHLEVAADLDKRMAHRNG